MSFCFYSKEFSSNSFTLVENQFITQYMPTADAFAVKVYIYGLYLCQNAHLDFSVSAFARALGCDEESVRQAFRFWEDYDLLNIQSTEPFVVEYLPVATALGKSRRVNYGSYSDFNKELMSKMQRVNRYVTRQELQKYMNFMQENNMEPQAFLLIAEYCIDKDGEKVSPAHIINKAKKYIEKNIITYEQVESELSGHNLHEGELEKVFEALGSKKPHAEEGDFTLYGKWLEEYGYSPAAILYVAGSMKRGDLTALDERLRGLKAKGIISDSDVKNHIEKQRALYEIAFSVARKLSVKINSPETYVDEYVAEWVEEGYSEKSLCDIAVYCTKLSANTFVEMDAALEELSSQGIISDADVAKYLAEQANRLKTLLKIKELCSQVRVTAAALTRIKTWREWGFSDAMLIEAAKRAATVANPLPYMNKILSDWKENKYTSPADVLAEKRKTGYSSVANETVQALDDKSKRERFYAERRRKAQALADKYIKKAETNPEYVKISSELASAKIELAKATVFDRGGAEAVQKKLDALRQRQRELLKSMGISEEQLTPRPVCARCSDTGFLPDGKACDCYNENE